MSVGSGGWEPSPLSASVPESQPGRGCAPVVTSERLVLAEDWSVTGSCRGLLAGEHRGARPHSRTPALDLAGLHPAFFPPDHQLGLPAGCASL